MLEFKKLVDTKPVEKKPFPINSEYYRSLKLINFLDKSTNESVGYADVVDPRGGTVLVRHEYESDIQYSRRKRLSVLYPYCSPVIDKYKSMVLFNRSRDSELSKNFKEVFDDGI